jgi:hypothetical protein
MSISNRVCDRCKKTNENGGVINILSGIPIPTGVTEENCQKIKEEYANINFLKKEMKDLQFQEFYVCHDCLSSAIHTEDVKEKQSTAPALIVLLAIAGLLVWLGIIRDIQGSGEVFFCFVPAGILILLSIAAFYDSFLRKKTREKDIHSPAEFGTLYPKSGISELLIKSRGMAAAYFDEDQFQGMFLPFYATVDVINSGHAKMLASYKNLVEYIQTPSKRYSCSNCGKSLEKVDMVRQGTNFFGALPILYDGVVCMRCGLVTCSSCKGLPLEAKCQNCQGDVLPAYENNLE